MQLYSEILDAGGPAFGSILRHVRDNPQEGFIFHCTGSFNHECARTPSLLWSNYLFLCDLAAGKDRTGIMAAILLLVCTLNML